jgi:hypothetical protein
LLEKLEMKVAFLITAYHQPLHLARLARALDYSWARFFIHVDAKKDIGAFTSVLAPSSKVGYLGSGQREICSWGGFGLVQATLNLIRTAIATKETFTRFCLLSGSDYPLKNSEMLFKALDTDREFLDVERRISQEPNPSGYDSRAAYYSFKDYPLLLRFGLSGRIPRNKYTEIPLYGGSGWWSLTSSSIHFALDFIRKHPSYLRYLRFVDIPDEMFFHSIVKASPFAKALSFDFERLGEEPVQRVDRVYGCHYTDWRNSISHPKVLDMTHLLALKNSHALFARKFEEVPSRALLEQIDNYRSS